MENLGVKPLRILVTGNDGYIGQVFVQILQSAGHEVVSLDYRLFDDCDFPRYPRPQVKTIVKDTRAVERTDLGGFDAVLHLAALSNDPLGDFVAPETAYAINHRASVRRAELCRDAGVSRFVFSSSCSNYGAAGDDFLGENATLNPVTPCAESKVWAERDVAPMANDAFSPTFMRSATAYGVSARLRADLVTETVPDTQVTFTGDASPDARNYRVDCGKIQRALPDSLQKWKLKFGIKQIYQAMTGAKLTKEEFLSSRSTQLSHVQVRVAAGKLDDKLHLLQRAA